MINKNYIKCLIVLSITLLLQNNCYSQITIRMTDTSNQWNIAFHYYSDDAIKPYDNWTTKFYTIEDSVFISGNLYQKLFCYSDSLLQSKSFVNYVREKDGKVYLTDSISEFMLFDFNMGKNDSFMVPSYEYAPFNFYDYQSFLIKVDSVYNLSFNDSLYLKAMNIKAFPYTNGSFLQNEWVEDTWVEGIGSLKYGFLYGINYAYFFSSGDYYSSSCLLCFHNSNKLIYQNKDFNTCEKYHPDDWTEQNLISENKQWTLISTNNLTGTQTSTPYIFAYYTKVNGVKYSRLYQKTGETIMSWPLQSLWYERNDSVWVKPIDEEKASLIYDFNIAKNDSFLVADSQNNYLVVDSVCVKFWGGKDRKHIYLHSSRYPEIITTWVYGVGQLGDFTKSTNAGIENADSLLCFEENNESVFQNPEYKSCSINNASHFIKTSEQFIELYSVGDGMIQIQIKNNSSGNLFLYNLDGKLVLKKPISEKEIKFCSPSFGLMLFRFLNKNGEIQTGKVMVE